MPHVDPHRDIAEREEEDEREAIAVAIEKFNAQRRHSLEVRMLLIAFEVTSEYIDNYRTVDYPSRF